MLTIRHEPLRPGFDKYHVEGLPFGCAIHEITKADIGLWHDHPYGMKSIVLFGGYAEKIYNPKFGITKAKDRLPGFEQYIPAERIHMITEVYGPVCYTLILPDPDHLRREWKFWKFEDGKAYYRQWNEQNWKLLK